MYLVDFKSFNEFISKKGLLEHSVPTCAVTPAIIEFRKDGVLMAKVEVVDFKVFNFLMKFAKLLSSKPVIKKGKTVCKNKYWIRGEEWQGASN